MGQSEQTSLPVLCRFWNENGVWNGSAEDVAVAVFGQTLEEAIDNLRAAVQNHFEAAIETGLIGPMVTRLTERAKELRFWSFDEISPNSPVLKMLVGISDNQSVAVM
jgi:predicted RNase H-like HicB family nuclease